MIQFTVDDRSVLAALTALRNRVENMEPAMREIGAGMVDDIRLGFTVSESPWGERWKPLKKRQGQPLRDTGQLMNSLAFRADASGVVIGPSDKAEKALLHQFGSSKASGRGSGVPARPYLPIRNGQADLPAEWTGSILDILQRHLTL